jgi:hypothetical protein
LTKRLSPPLLGILDDDVGLTLEEFRDLRELGDGLTLDTEAYTRTTEQDKHSLIE